MYYLFGKSDCVIFINMMYKNECLCSSSRLKNYWTVLIKVMLIDFLRLEGCLLIFFDPYMLVHEN